MTIHEQDRQGCYKALTAALETK